MVYYALIRTADGIKWQARNGTRVRNEPGLKLYAEKRSKNCWIITEAQSGMNIAEGTLKKLAVQNLEDKLSYFGMEWFENAVSMALERYGESPLYTDEPKLPVIPLPKE